MALSANRDTQKMVGDPLPSRLEFPVAAGEIIYKGALVVTSATGYLEAATAAASKFAVGRAAQYVDNSAGGDGDLYCKVDQGVFKWANSAGGGEVLQAHITSDCYITDDEQVTILSAATSRAGTVMQVDTDGVWVYTALHPVAAASVLSTLAKKTLRVQHSDLVAAAGTQTLNLDTALPANARVMGVELRIATDFSGGGAAAVTCDVGGTDPDCLIDGADIFTGAAAAYANSAGQISGGGSAVGINPNGKLSAQQLTITVDADVNVADLNAGDLTIDVFYSVLA